MDTETLEILASESSVTLRLAHIQHRCSRLLAGQDELTLSLEDTLNEPAKTNPYNLG